MSSSWQTILNLLPLDLGSVKHSLQWVISESKDKFYSNPNFRPPEDGRSVLGKKGMVLYLIHGTADYPDVFNELIGNLLLKLPSYVYGIRNVTLEKRFQGLSIEEQARQIIGKMKANGDTDVGFIGHSRGGLDAQRVDAIVTKEKEHNIRVHLVTNVCTPYQGSYLAIRPLTSASDSVAQMAIGADYLEEVEKEVMQSSAAYYFILARNDYIVEPTKCYLPKYVEQHPDSVFVIENTGHLEIIYKEFFFRRCHTILEKLESSLKPRNLATEEMHEEKPLIGVTSSYA
ncbi:hypothetical protein B6N58_11270 [Legionella micdadei]|uniref:Lipase n=2 Tax=Legionella micdadei TaxID=451 RepID=A0A098GCE4_LEGMI|nr:hypothetical protein B6N58_11270 [Legionella micdadei]ARH00982.1 hypothetical protein B6V88_11500 [Legionella micdadei]KTD29964.1 putative lipase [Legionella micdadei]CEG60154.1 protein of unknown function [Legionella micdadei]SCY64451.1 hypothetical protein SAMN02982997_02353 [Legionella micdadei]